MLVVLDFEKGLAQGAMSNLPRRPLASCRARSGTLTLPAMLSLSLSFLLSPSPFSLSLALSLSLPPPSYPSDNKPKTSCHLGRRARPAPPAQRALGLYLLLVAALNSHPPIGACIHPSDALLTLNLAGVCWERGTSRDLWNISHRFTLDSAI